MSATLSKPMTADELLAMPDDGRRYELVKGELLMAAPPGSEHGEITMNLAAPLHRYAKSKNLGVVYATETGFKLETDPDTVRAPDIAFVRQGLLDQSGRIPGYLSGAPDLVVEVLSPSDTFGKVEAKVTQWLEAGARMVWVVSPRLH